MDIELSTTSAAAKARALQALGQQGYRAASGPVRLAYPFAIVVEGVPDDDEDGVLRVVTHADPGAGRIAAVR